MDALFGPTLLTGAKGGEKTEKPTSEVLANKAGVLVYFSAHWCPPCRGFTPKLSQFYEKHAEAKNFEIVFVSSDQDEDQFKEYHQEMPFPALPFADRERKAALSKQFKVQGIPSLVVLDSDASLITTNGRDKVMGDFETCEDFPWRPLSFTAALGNTLAKQDGTEVGAQDAIAGKTLAIYFSAHWCPPCRGFTPKLKQFYKEYKKLNPSFEIIFSSGDQSKEEADAYFKDAHGDYLMIPFANTKGRAALDEIFAVEGIPTLVICDAQGNVINKDGRAKVGACDAAAAAQVHAAGWEPPLIGDLADGPGAQGTDINESKTVLVCTHGLEPSVQAAAGKAMETVASELKAKAAPGEAPEAIFIASKAAGGMADQIARLTQKNGGARCAEPCSDGKPLILLFDIPSDGAFYVCESTEVTAESLRAFCKSPGTRCQLER